MLIDNIQRAERQSSFSSCCILKRQGLLQGGRTAPWCINWVLRRGHFSIFYGNEDYLKSNHCYCRYNFYNTGLRHKQCKGIILSCRPATETSFWWKRTLHQYNTTRSQKAKFSATLPTILPHGQ
jgi:hypothetical protein